eukprot:7262561-Pyramimonas_sp.AAC.1
MDESTQWTQHQGQIDRRSQRASQSRHSLILLLFRTRRVWCSSAEACAWLSWSAAQTLKTASVSGSSSLLIYEYTPSHTHTQTARSPSTKGK